MAELTLGPIGQIARAVKDLARPNGFTVTCSACRTCSLQESWRSSIVAVFV